MALTDLTGIFSDIANAAGGINGQTVLDSIAAGTLGTVVIAGAQSQKGQDALDPLNLFHHPAAPATATTPATPAVTGVVAGNVITMTQYNALSPDGQKTVQALKYTIIPG